MADPGHFVVNCSILLTHLPLLRRPQAARDAGFGAVEFWWPFDDSVPGDAEVDAFVRAIGDAGVRLAALNFAGGDMTAGERGILSDPLRISEFRDNAEVAFGIGARLGTSAFNALYGNRIAGCHAARQDEVAAGNLALVSARAEEVGATILIEPLSGVAGYPLRTGAEVISVLDRIGAPSLRLLADLYHLSVNGDDLTGVIEAYADRIGHVQLADAPGRGEPGTGDIDFSTHLAHLHRRGYRGDVSLEYRSAAADPFGWLAPSRRSAGPWNR
ncbi:hydroxypyruvate isomerase family protein [Mycobacterium sp. NPDC003323]